MPETSQNSLIQALEMHFGDKSFPALKNNINYEDLRTSLALHLKTLLNENRAYFYASLYRIDVSEKDVKLALSQNFPEYVLAEMILKKLNEKLYWRNKYKSDEQSK